MTEAIISDIKHFAVHDGDGIRTNVFLKGCPLKCAWCHNPESISPKPQIAFFSHKCINCGECVKICSKQAHVFEGAEHEFYRKNCISCGQCEDICLGSALKLYGKKFSVSGLLPLLLEDKDFYESSGGGVTLSGGECLLYPDFCRELLMALKDEGINTAVDTCGFVPKEAFDKVMPYTDIFLYDIKAIDENIHIKCTGQSNKIILENLKYIDDSGKNIEVRIPYAPGYNSNEKDKIINIIKQFNNITKVRVLAYHNYAGSKYAALYMKNTLSSVIPSEKEVEQFQREINQSLLR